MRPPGRRELACGALAFLLLAAAFVKLGPTLSAAPARLSAGDAALGHGLLTGAHAARLDPAYRLPLGTLAELFAEETGAAGPLLLLADLSAALLAAAAGALLAGPWAGALAGALALFVTAGLPAPEGLLKMRLFAPLLLLPALALALRARRPGARADWLAGASFAPALLYRSTLAFLPPLLALWTLARGRDGDAARSAGRLLLPAALALLPWAAMNKAVHGTWTPFERGASDMLVVGGALGMVDTTPEGDRRLLAPGAPEGPGVTAWAVKTVLGDPAPYLAAVAKRLLFALGLLPWLVLAAAAGFWRARRDPAARSLALFAGYFFLIHALLATLAYYYDPVWPVLAALAAGLLAARAPAADGERFAGRLLLAALLPALALATGAAALSVRYGRLAAETPPASDEAVQRALAARPGDPRLLLRRAELALAAGRPAEARRDAQAAYDLAPGAAAFLLARAAEASGERGAAEELARSFSSPASFDRDGRRLELWLWRAVYARKNGERDASEAALAEAAAQWRGAQRLTVARGEREQGWERRLREGADVSLGRRAAELFEGHPPASWVPYFADAALEAAPRAARLPLLLLQQADPKAACPRLERLAKAAPSARAEIDAGVCRFLERRPGPAAAAFRRALALDPSSSEAAAGLAALRDTKAASPSSKK